MLKLNKKLSELPILKLIKRFFFGTKKTAVLDIKQENEFLRNYSKRLKTELELTKIKLRYYEGKLK